MTSGTPARPDAAFVRGALERVLEDGDLTQDEAGQLLFALTAEDLAPALAGAVLAALRAKGATADELRGFAGMMRSLARRPQLPPLKNAVDIVGTGGDASGSFNLSTGAALLVTACGVPVIKHGNRSVSSRAGSADVLEALGLPMPMNEAAAVRCFEALRFTFLFAPYYHAATRNIAPVRAALGVRTVFNVLGPLSNPAAPPYLVIGAFDLATADLMAHALKGSGIRRAFVIHGAQGWDEPTPIGPFTLFDVDQHSVRCEQRSPQQYGLPLCDPEALGGADAAHNARELTRALTEPAASAHRDALLLGAALALEVTGSEPEPLAAVARAARTIDNGDAAALLGRLRHFGEAERSAEGSVA